nr:splicing factor U2af small subunit B-like [Tanacetum cinerariifolium]
MVGNVYVQFREEEYAAKALKNLTGRYYAGRPIIIGRDLRRQLFGRYRRRHSRSRSRSRSPYRHRSYEERGHGSRGHSRRYDDRDRDRDREYRYESRSRRHRSTSPLHRRERSSSESRRHHSPVREGSEERRAKIEEWNRQREEAKLKEINGSYGNHTENGDGYNNQQPEQYGH